MTVEAQFEDEVPRPTEIPAMWGFGTVLPIRDRLRSIDGRDYIEGVGFLDEQLPGFVYFIQAASLEGPIKIGFTRNNPTRRLRILQVGSPVRLAVRGAFPATAVEEVALHGRFEANHSHGEWFDPTPELCAIADGDAEIAWSIDHWQRGRRKDSWLPGGHSEVADPVEVA